MNLSSYFSALKKVKAINKEISEQEKALDETVKQIGNKYYDQIRSLKSKIQDLEYEEETEKTRLKTAQKNNEQKTKEANQSHYDTIKQTERIFKFMGIFLFGPDVPSGTISYRELDFFSGFVRKDLSTVPFHVIADDPYKIVSVHIANNRKPKNKYSLILTVNSVFRRSFEDLFNWNSESIIRYGATKESLLAWYEKNKSTILVPIRRAEYKPIAEFLKDHEALEQEYEQAKILYNDPEWELAYWKDQKKYYEEQVSRGTDSEKYVGILEMIKIIQTPDLLLPTLLPLKSELGRYAFDKRCKKEQE